MLRDRLLRYYLNSMNKFIVKFNICWVGYNRKLLKMSNCSPVAFSLKSLLDVLNNLELVSSAMEKDLPSRVCLRLYNLTCIKSAA